MNDEERLSTPSLLKGYGGEDEMPVGGYSVLLAAWFAAAVTTGLVARASERRFPKEVPFKDIALFGVATHKIARIATKDWVTSPLRAPFTRYRKSLGAGEVAESSRGDGLQRAIGDLMTCPWCSGPWIAGGLFAIYLFQPRAARFIASIFGAVTISDWMHHLYEATKELPDRASTD